MQEGHPIAYASRALTDTECRYAQIEKEMLAIVWSVEKFNQYTYGRHTEILSDHKPLESIMKKELAKAPRRLQAMIMRLQKCQVHVTYMPGKKMYIADTLSRAFLPGTGDQKEFEHVHAAQYVPMTKSRLETLREATDEDDTLTKVKQVILEGWPIESTYLTPDVRCYYPFRDEMAVHDGIVYRGERVVIPVGQRKTLKERVHSSHLGIDGCLRRAREAMFWPGMVQEIRDYISACQVCRKYEAVNPKEPLMSHEVSDRPWTRIGTHLFSHKGTNYLITVDYYSNFWEIDKLTSTESMEVIGKLKLHFSRYGIPDCIVSDNGPQYTSQEFARMCKALDITHVTSSPGNSKANGKAESAVKTAKRILTKCQETGSDVYLAILDLRNTPTQGILSSPVQRMMSRKTKTLLPTTSESLKPAVVDPQHTRRDMKLNQKKQAEYYNKHSRSLPALDEEDKVRLKPFQLSDRTWRKGTIVRRLDQRSYEIETDKGTTVRRCREHVRKIPHNTEAEKEPDKEQPAVKESVKEQGVPIPEHFITTRSGRTSNKPTRFQE